MRKRWIVLAIILLILGIIFYHPFMEAYDNYVDKWADPSYNGPNVFPRYKGGWFEYYTNSNFPYSKLVMIKNSTSRNYTKTAFLSTEITIESGIGGKDYWLVEEIKYAPNIYEKVEYYIEWWILNYTIYIEEEGWLHWNGTDWIEGPVEFYKWHDWECVANLSMWDFPFDDGLFNKQYNLTLHANWFGYIQENEKNE